MQYIQMVRNLKIVSPSAASIFSAELHTILAAFKITRDLRNHYIVICASRSGLQATKALNSSYPVVVEVQNWRIGISGNEATAAQPCDACFPLPHKLETASEVAFALN